VISLLERKYEFYVWQKIDANHSAIRLVTSWATTEEAVEGFLDDLGELKGIAHSLPKHTNL
jgi:threonine aldolase